MTVADSGQGIQPQHMPRLFEAFFTTKEAVGTGLGLWSTKQILDANDGCVHVRSSVGRGTVVVACWPTAQEREVVLAGT